MVSLEHEVESKWSQVENQYQRRFDLIPNLIETENRISVKVFNTYIKKFPNIMDINIFSAYIWDYKYKELIPIFCLSVFLLVIFGWGIANIPLISR